MTAAVEALRALYEEVGRREARLAELGAKKVTRPLAEKHPDLRPLVGVVLRVPRTVRRPRPTAGKPRIWRCRPCAGPARPRSRSAFDTQSSRADAIPPKIVELVKLNACFAVKSWRSNDGFLGDGSFQAGIRATELRMGKDVGTSILTGATAERFEIVKWFYIEADDDTGFDAAADIIARAMAEPASRGRRPVGRPGASPRRWCGICSTTSRLCSASTGADAVKVPAADIPARLRSLAPDWTPYRSISGLRHPALPARPSTGSRCATTGRKYPVDPAAIRDAIARRDAAPTARTVRHDLADDDHRS